MVNKQTNKLDRTQMGGRSFLLPSRSVAAEAPSCLEGAREGISFIPLTNKYVAIVSQEDFEFLSRFKWSPRHSGKIIYATRNKGSWETASMHREVLCPPSRVIVDHINGDGLDNRRSNLRFATHSQNMMNRGKHTKASSEFKGVSFITKGRVWASQIRSKGVNKWIGHFKTEIEAALAYDKAASECFGEFARLNFPKHNHQAYPVFSCPAFHQSGTFTESVNFRRGSM